MRVIIESTCEHCLSAWINNSNFCTILLFLLSLELPNNLISRYGCETHKHQLSYLNSTMLHNFVLLLIIMLTYNICNDKY